VETTDGYSLYSHTDDDRVSQKIPSSLVVYLPKYVRNVTLCQMEVQELKQEITVSVMRIILPGLVQVTKIVFNADHADTENIFTYSPETSLFW
jgi:hypothetical protein